MRGEEQRGEERRREERSGEEAEIWLLSDNVKRKLNNAETRQ